MVVYGSVNEGAQGTQELLLLKYCPERPCCLGMVGEPRGPSASPGGPSWYQLGFLPFQLFHTEKVKGTRRPTHDLRRLEHLLHGH